MNNKRAATVIAVTVVICALIYTTLAWLTNWQIAITTILITLGILALTFEGCFESYRVLWWYKIKSFIAIKNGNGKNGKPAHKATTNGPSPVTRLSRVQAVKNWLKKIGSKARASAKKAVLWTRDKFRWLWQKTWPLLKKIGSKARASFKKLMVKIRRALSRKTPSVRGVKPPNSPSYPEYREIELNKIQAFLACLAGIGLVFILVFIALNALVIFLAGSWYFLIEVGNKTYVINWFPLMLVLAVFYIAGSFQRVAKNENAVKIAFGYMFEDVGPGLTLVPRWICKLVRTTNVITLAGGTPEKVVAVEWGENLEVKVAGQMFEQIKLVRSEAQLFKSAGGTFRVCEDASLVTFANRETAKYFREGDETIFRDTKNPLTSQFTADLKIVMGFLIPKSGTRVLIKRFGSQFVAMQKINDLMTSHMHELCSRITLEYFVHRVGDVVLMLQLILEKLLGEEIEVKDCDKQETYLKRLGLNIKSVKSLGKTGISTQSLRLEAVLPKNMTFNIDGVAETGIKAVGASP